MAGCRMVSQVAAQRPLEDPPLLDRLLTFLDDGLEDTTEAAAEALLFASLRCNEKKLMVLELIQKHPWLGGAASGIWLSQWFVGVGTGCLGWK